MAKERKTEVWEGNDEEIRRLFTLTPDDLYFLQPLRVDTQRLYRALVLVWARVERVLLSDTASIPEGVIKRFCQNSEEDLAWRSLMRYAKNTDHLMRRNS